jgi:RNA polymerase sigma factor (sigma-70 family)
MLLNHARQALQLAPRGAADSRLLDRFRSGDDAAFELLVWRHGPMVLGVCRRILGDEHAAEDAFQTVFLALAQKCGAIGRGEAVGAWLYRVAYRTAIRLRLRDARRAERERIAGLARAEQTVPDPAERLSWEELRPRLDAEVARLPVEYQTAFILCHLEGKTNEEAARELGCPVGTIQSRLSRARARLRSRLRRQGLGPESIPFILFIQRPQAPPDVPPALVYLSVRYALQASAEQTGAASRLKPPRKRRWLFRAALAVLLMAPASAALAYGVRWIIRPVNPPTYAPTDATPVPPPTAGAMPTSAGSCH